MYNNPTILNVTHHHQNPLAISELSYRYYRETYEGMEWNILLQDSRNQSVAVLNCNLFKLPLSV
jgi:hypothetical protein